MALCRRVILAYRDSGIAVSSRSRVMLALNSMRLAMRASSADLCQPDARVLRRIKGGKCPRSTYL